MSRLEGGPEGEEPVPDCLIVAVAGHICVHVLRFIFRALFNEASQQIILKLLISRLHSNGLLEGLLGIEEISEFAEANSE
jgi:hypothetical protein